MVAPQFFPITPEFLTLACETVNRRVGQIPFLHKGVEITREKIGVAMECLNAEVTRTLPLRTSPAMTKNMIDGFDRAFEIRMGANKKSEAATIADVLVQSGITDIVDVQDRCTHTRTNGLRLISAWSWHIASGVAPEYHSPDPQQEPELPAAWMAKCPICKLGILQKVTGKQLFGIRATDFYIDCTHCGAKFTPERENFRLVSIAKIQDPRWKQLLNTCRSPDAWAALAQTSTSVHRHIVSASVKKSVPKSTGNVNTGVFSKLKDGSIAVPFGEKTLFFRQVKLQFGRSLQQGLFTRSTRTLADIIALPLFSDLQPAISREYDPYLPNPVGAFLDERKKRGEALYAAFLNAYGDEEYCSFRIDEDENARQKGVVLILVRGKVGYAGSCHTTFGTLINDELGRILPDMCYRDGNMDACGINSLICSSREAVGVYIHSMTGDAAIDEVARDIKSRYCAIPPGAG
ncbi:MAG: hypothetical protein PHF64_02245 [Methanoregula sp.]|nr:hypothetical protein [Methanoregula sp.]